MAPYVPVQKDGTDVISIVRHRREASGLLEGRLASLGVRLPPAVLASLALDERRNTARAGDKVRVGSAVGAQVVVSGVVGEVRRMPDGRRQILRLALPGDLIAARPVETVVALTDAELAGGAELSAALTDPRPEFTAVRRGWLIAQQVDDALLRDHVMRLGRLSAEERIAQFLVETHERLAVVGLATDLTFHLPLTQEQIGDLLGLSVVHLNRKLQELRRQALVASRKGYVTLLDRPELVAMSNYVSRLPVPWRSADAREPRVGRLAVL